VFRACENEIDRAMRTWHRSSVKQYIAEMLGTFGLVVMAMIYAFGDVSGAESEFAASGWCLPTSWRE